MRCLTSSGSSMGPRRRKVTDPLAGAVLVVLGVPVSAALGHYETPMAPEFLWRAWNWEPMVLFGLALAAWVYGRGVRALWRRAGSGRGIRYGKAVAFGAGLMALFAALVSPLDGLSAALASAHMVQHLVLILIAAPLLVLGAPLVPLLWAVPKPMRRALGGWWKHAAILRAAWSAFTRPVVVWLLNAAAMWIWHFPALYQAALRSEFIHAVEHICLFGTAILFWRTIFPSGKSGRLSYGTRVLYVFAMGTQSGVLGAFLTFAPTPWYPAYAASVAAWGFTPLEDQQLAGLIMWVPAGLIYLHVAVFLFMAWLRAEERIALPAEIRLGSGYEFKF
jgi:putative membrane protein